MEVCMPGRPRLGPHQTRHKSILKLGSWYRLTTQTRFMVHNYNAVVQKYLKFGGQQMVAEMDVCMGGRAAEELIFGVGKIPLSLSLSLSLPLSRCLSISLSFSLSLARSLAVYVGVTDLQTHGKHPRIERERERERETEVYSDPDPNPRPSIFGEEISRIRILLSPLLFLMQVLEGP